MTYLSEHLSAGFMRPGPELHILPERVGNSDFSQDQLLVDMVQNLILTKTIFSRNLIHFEIRF